MNNKGFTILELLVVSAMIGILSVAVLAGYRTGERQLALQRAGQKLTQDIRRTQEMAMSLKELPSGGIPPGGYGIFFQRYGSVGQYNYDIYFYADINNNQRYSAGGDLIVETIYRESQKIYLEKGVKIKQINLNNGPAACDDENPYPTEFHINFAPPDPIVDIKRATGPSCPQATIIIALTSNENIIKTITVNNVGLIYVK